MRGRLFHSCPSALPLRGDAVMWQRRLQPGALVLAAVRPRVTRNNFTPSLFSTPLSPKTPYLVSTPLSTHAPSAVRGRSALPCRLLPSRSLCARVVGSGRPGRLLQVITQSRPSNFSTQVKKSEKPGLYGLPGLHQPEDLKRKLVDVVAQTSATLRQVTGEHAELRQRAARGEAVQWGQWGKRVLRHLDDMSETLCFVADTAEVCRLTHPDPVWQQACRSVCLDLGTYFAQLNSHRPLYEVLDAVVSAEAFTKELSEEEQRVAVLLLREFQAHGIHLEEREREEVIRMQRDIMDCVFQFQSNIVNDDHDVSVSLPNSVAKQLPMRDLSRLSLDVHPEDRARVVATAPAAAFEFLLKHVPLSEDRRPLYVASLQSAPSNRPVLQELMGRRHALAKRLGYECFGEVPQPVRVMSNPETVRQFLLDLNAAIRPRVEVEMDMLKDAKMTMEGSRELYAWDYSFYTVLLKSDLLRNATRLAPISEHLSLQNVLRGMSLVLDSIFGLQIEIDEETPPAEDGEVWHPSVLKLRVKTGDVEGTVYLDLFDRPGKADQNATFGIQFARRVGEIVQSPRTAVVCNFERTSRETAQGWEGCKDELLSHWEAINLFHEMGHACHILLSRTNFQHTSGVRCALDYAETPSQLMENYMWDSRVLRKFAVHHQTGQPVAAEQIALLQDSRQMFRGLELLQQIKLALLDIDLHSASGADPVFVDQREAEIQAELGPFPAVPEGHYRTRFSHLTNYGANYYSYLLSGVFAAQLWSTHFASDPLSREGGDRLRGMLEKGGSVPAADLLRDALGGTDPLSLCADSVRTLLYRDVSS